TRAPARRRRTRGASRSANAARAQAGRASCRRARGRFRRRSFLCRERAWFGKTVGRLAGGRRCERDSRSRRQARVAGVAPGGARQKVPLREQKRVSKNGTSKYTSVA